MQSFTLSRLPEIIFGAGSIADLAAKVEGAVAFATALRRTFAEKHITLAAP